MRRVLIGVTFIALLIGSGCYFFSEDEEKTRLAVTVSGLPKGVKAKVEVSGPEKFTLTGSNTREVKPGRYTIRVKTVTLKNKDVASGPDVDVNVPDGGTKKATADYQNIVSWRTRVFRSPSEKPVRVDDARVFFSGSNQKAAGLRKGQYLLSASSERMPYPLIREVTAVTATASEIIVDTRAVALDKAMPRYRFDFDKPDPLPSPTAHGRHSVSPASFPARGPSDDPLAEISKTDVKIGGSVSLADDVYKFTCEGTPPDLTWQLKSFQPTLEGYVSATHEKLGGKVVDKAIGVFEKVTGLDVPDAVINDGVEAEVKAGLTAEQNFTMAGDYRAGCSQEYDILKAAVAAATMGQGKGGTAKSSAVAKQLLEKCAPVTAKNDVLGSDIRIPCSIEGIKIVHSAEVGPMHLNTWSHDFSSSVSIRSMFRAEVLPRPQTDTDFDAGVDPFTLHGPVQEPDFEAPEISAKLGAALKVEAEFSFGDPIGVAAFSLKSSASTGVNLASYPAYSGAVVLEGQLKAGVVGNLAVDPLRIKGIDTGNHAVIEASIDKGDLIDETCLLGGPWYPLKPDGPTRKLKIKPCTLKDKGHFETPSPSLSAETDPGRESGPKKLPRDLKVPVYEVEADGTYTSGEFAVSGEKIGQEMEWDLDPCHRNKEYGKPDRHSTETLGDFRPESRAQQQIVAFDSVKSAKKFVDRYRADSVSPKCRTPEETSRDVVSVHSAPVNGFAVHEEGSFGMSGQRSMYSQLMRVANTVVLTVLTSRDTGRGTLGTGLRPDVTAVHKEFAKYLCGRPEWHC